MEGHRPESGQAGKGKQTVSGKLMLDSTDLLVGLRAVRKGARVEGLIERLDEDHQQKALLLRLENTTCDERKTYC